MKKVALIIVFVLCTLNAGAQGIARMCNSLGITHPSTGAWVYVSHCDSVAITALKTGDRNGREYRMPMYRISLFLDNSQTAGSEASAVAAKFRAFYPSVSCEVSYASPYFKVVAGAFDNHIDAVAMRGVLIGQFPKAVIIQDDVPTSRVASYTPVKQKPTAFEVQPDNYGTNYPENE